MLELANDPSLGNLPFAATQMLLYFCKKRSSTFEPTTMLYYLALLALMMEDTETLKKGTPVYLHFSVNSNLDH